MRSTPRERHLAHALGTALLAGRWEDRAMRQRTAAALGRTRNPPWVVRLIAQVLDRHPRPPLDAPRELAQLLLVLPAWAQGRANHRKLKPVHWSPAETEMGRSRWPVTPLATVADLARLLDVTIAELEWFADVRHLERGSAAPLRHYRVLTRAKPNGVRVLEVPKPRLREIQRRLLRHCLAPMAMHPSAQGAVPGTSVATALAPHVGRRTVVRCDLASFFPSVSAARVWGVLRTAGYPEAVAHAIAGLTTTVISRREWADIGVPRGSDAHDAHDAHRRLGRQLATPHLPQGAPSSPALANLVAFGLDRRLTGLAHSLDLAYTRYVDDLIFSGDEVRTAKLVRAVERIAADEGFHVAEHKTVARSNSQRQQFLGAVLNAKVGVPRTEIDRLRAVVHNCVVWGWASQSRGLDADGFRARLTGQIAWVNGLDPRRGALLRERAAAIDWSS